MAQGTRGSDFGGDFDHSLDTKGFVDLDCDSDPGISCKIFYLLMQCLWTARNKHSQFVQVRSLECFLVFTLIVM